MCSHVCSVFYWLIGDALLTYCDDVSLRLHLPCFNLCWSFGMAGLVWYPCSRLKLLPAARIPPQPSHTDTPTHIETRTHDQCVDKIGKSQAPDDECINVRNMLNIEEVK